MSHFLFIFDVRQHGNQTTLISSLQMSINIPGLAIGVIGGMGVLWYANTHMKAGIAAPPAINPIILGIGLIIVVALYLFFFRQSSFTSLPMWQRWLVLITIFVFLVGFVLLLLGRAESVFIILLATLLLVIAGVTIIFTNFFTGLYYILIGVLLFYIQNHLFRVTMLNMRK